MWQHCTIYQQSSFVNWVAWWLCYFSPAADIFLIVHNLKSTLKGRKTPQDYPQEDYRKQIHVIIIIFNYKLHFCGILGSLHCLLETILSISRCWSYWLTKDSGFSHAACMQQIQILNFFLLNLELQTNVGKKPHNLWEDILFIYINFKLCVQASDQDNKTAAHR